MSITVSGGKYEKIVRTEADIRTALVNLQATGGGIIVITQPITLTSNLTLSAGIRVDGRGLKHTLTLASGATLILSGQAEIRDLRISHSKTTGDLVQISSGNRNFIQNVQFYLTAVNSVTGVRVSSSNNRILSCSFYGAVGGSATGIYYASGSDNVDRDSLFA